MLKKSEDVILLFGRSIIGLYFLLPGAIAKIFNYDFSPYYGSKYLCSGLNISTDNNNAGYINTKILISC